MLEKIVYRAGQKNLTFQFIMIGRGTKDEMFSIYAVSYGKVVARGYSEKGCFKTERLFLRKVSKTTTKHMWLSASILTELSGCDLDSCLMFFDLLESHNSFNSYYPSWFKKQQIIKSFIDLVN